ncbi:hypothetical protein HHI36_024411 [Cryptolaemus montrouzieri]|uniref:C2H2-type domain-containing protein n=1 Tax=Cryptolaemus montrouzieri TaxID=559131 RepID=A0ABD2MW76_9CUCU
MTLLKTQRAVPAARLRVIRERPVGPASTRVTLGTPHSNNRASDEEVHVPVLPRNQQGNIAVEPAVDTDTPPEEVYGEFIGCTFLIGVPFIGSSCSCTGCQKEYVSKHAAVCHVPKCTGPVAPAPNAVRCDICGTYYKNKIQKHERTALPEVRNEARARPSGGARKRRLRQGGYMEDEVNLMLELERRFHGDRFVAKKMEESSGDEEVAIQEEIVPQPALPEADGDETQPPPQATEPDLPVVVPTIVVSPPLDPSSPQETRWRQEITDKALAHKLPKKAIPDESAEAIRLLRGAFQFASELNYDVPHAHDDDIYKEVTSDFVSSDCEDERERRPSRVRGKGEVAKYVRTNVDWLKGYSQPNSANVEELYTQLWGTQPKVQLPEMGQAEGLITLEDTLLPFTLREIGKRVAHLKKSTATGSDGI